MVSIRIQCVLMQPVAIIVQLKQLENRSTCYIIVYSVLIAPTLKKLKVENQNV